MTDHEHRDHEPRDQDKPIDLENAADHRPPQKGEPGWYSGGGTPEDQNPSASAPPDSQAHKRQRSQGMNHSGWEGKG